MKASDAELEAIELGSLLMPRIDPRARLLDIHGVVARDTEQASPFFNLVANARLDEASADAAITRVVDHFAGVGRPFGWVIGPMSKPRDLAARLAARGLTPLGSATGWVKRDLARPIETSPAVDVRKIGSDTTDVDRVKSVLFDIPVATARWIDEQIVEGHGGWARLYAASLDGWTVAFAQTYYYRDVALLAGAGVLEDARKQGVYRALLARRLADAQRHGADSVVIQAIGETQAAIAARFGFERVCEVTLLGWRPTGPRP